MKKFIIRALSGIVYAGLIIFAMLWHNQAAFVMLFGIFTALGIGEFGQITQPDQRKINVIIDIFGGVTLFESLMLPMGSYTGMFPYVLVAYLIVKMIVMLYAKEPDPLRNLAYGVLGVIYVALPLSLLGLLYQFEGAPLVLALFAFIWLSDSGAYMVGSLIGKHKLFPRISPNKSWEGTIGGTLLAGLAGFLAGMYLPEYLFYDKWMLAGVGVATAVFSTWGDLIESLFKRTLGIKDSGNVMPGHGGILDRLDSLLLVAPTAAFFFLFLRHFL